MLFHLESKFLLAKKSFLHLHFLQTICKNTGEQFLPVTMKMKNFDTYPCVIPATICALGDKKQFKIWMEEF